MVDVAIWLWLSEETQQGNSSNQNSARPLKAVQTKQLKMYYIAKLKYMLQNIETLGGCLVMLF